MHEKSITAFTMVILTN